MLPVPGAQDQGGEVAGRRLVWAGEIASLFHRFDIRLHGAWLDAEPLRVTGYQLGHYEVRRGADGTELAVPTLELGVRLLTPAGRVAPRPATLPLAELKARVREIERDRAPIVR